MQVRFENSTHEGDYEMYGSYYFLPISETNGIKHEVVSSKEKHYTMVNKNKQDGKL